MGKIGSKDAEIFEFYIDTFFQGQGIGNILIKDCIE